MKIIEKSFNELTHQELFDLFYLRIEVFVVQQQCCYQEVDEIDLRANHFLMNENEELIGCARVYNQENIIKIGRFISKYPNKSNGKKLMQHILQSLKNNQMVELEAQVQAIGFYESCGFEVVSEPYDDQGILHVTMSYKKGAQDV